MMEFHISRAARIRYKVDDVLFSLSGNVIFADVGASRQLAQAINAQRATEAGREIANAGALYAMGLIDELSHAMVAEYRKRVDAAVFTEALRWFSQQFGAAAIERLCLAFVTEFPPVAVFRGELTAEEWLSQQGEGVPHREIAFEEMLFLWLANNNPAFAPYAELFDATELAKSTPYAEVAASFATFFKTRPPFSATEGSLLDVLLAPMLASPDSLTGQLDFIRTRWATRIGAQIDRVLLTAVSVLREEEIAIWKRFHPAVPGRHRHADGSSFAEGFEGDEFVGFDGAKRRRYAFDHQAPLVEYEAFSQDQAWMPNVVMMAKSTFVWLEQLSKKYGRHIHQLDQIPDEELALMASRGMTALWLIGLWERSIASRTIKRLRGQDDAVASAYSLKEYNIAEDLGGNSAYESLRDRAARYGIRLASDMVPNHMGIDSPWVVDHPDWFISRPVSPFPSYSFEGPDLSNDSRVEIKIEDHYFDQTDAAVVFRMRHTGGDTRFIYHGNDGTTFAWNDTAQLDYSKAYVREHVMQTILHVARLFPIIRFDAAMVLAKRHVQRLWFPLPGQGGSIPSRAENAMTQEEFDALMPAEFWREVVDRVAVEVPGTLLLAEAFWLLEGYFVRTLGMHRVYNSAFMNMLRDEENAKYRSYLKKTIEFDPDIMKRYVNFMSNPDERTTVDQFGSGDKCFGVATMLATLPGLPMFGHGQIEGFTERYGMEYKQARMDESINEGLVERHQREIAPLLKKRHVFAESEHFVLYDFWNDGGSVDENVFAYSNRSGNERALILYNNAYASTRGTVHVSAASMDKGSGELRQRRLHEALGLSGDPSLFIRYTDPIRGLEYLRRASDLEHHGFFMELRGYQYVVLQDWEELRSTAEEPWDRICDALHGTGVYSLRDALSKLRLQPLHDALRQALRSENVNALAAVAQDAPVSREEQKAALPRGKSKSAQNGSLPALPETLEPLQASAARFFQQAAHFGVDRSSAAGDGPIELCGQMTRAAVGIGSESRHTAALWPMHLRSILPAAQAGKPSPAVWTPVLAWLLLHSLAGASGGTRTFHELQVRSALAELFSSQGIGGEDAWRAAGRVRVLLLWAELLLATDPLTGAQAVFQAGTEASQRFWQDADVRWLFGVNEAGSHTYVNRELLEEMVTTLQLPTLLLLRAGHWGDTAEQISAPLVAVVNRAQRVGYDLGATLEADAPTDVEQARKVALAGASRGATPRAPVTAPRSSSSPKSSGSKATAGKSTTALAEKKPKAAGSKGRAPATAGKTPAGKGAKQQGGKSPDATNGVQGPKKPSTPKKKA